jgi:hypothetical protein
MAAASPSSVSVQHISIPSALSTFVDNLKQLPNSPASLYLTVDAKKLVIYVPLASTVNIVNLQDLKTSLDQGDGSALDLKTFLESGKIIQVFFDARPAAKILLERCCIKMSIEVRLPICLVPGFVVKRATDCTLQAGPKQSYIHELQVMEAALHKHDHEHMWLSGLDKCIGKDSVQRPEELGFRNSALDAEYDTRILHFPTLWKKYHDKLVNTKS